MIASMTGYANVSREAGYGAMAVELRSVNHRYLEVQLRVPEELRSVEAQLRELIAGQISRGKVECRVGYAPLKAAARTPNLNSALLSQLLDLEGQVQAQSPRAHGLAVGDILRWPGIFLEEPQPLELMSKDALELLQQALLDFAATRQREGEKLGAVLLDRVTKMEGLVAQVGPKVPELVNAYREKLSARVAEALATPDDLRLQQEVVLFASKVDIDEELSRLSAHLSEVKRVLKQGGVVGKRLDFLMQELNREANTVGSKAAAYDVSRVSVELKILIEQMREQVQNIE